MHLLASLQPQATNSAEHGSLSPATGGAHAGTGKTDAGDAGQRNTPGKCCLAVSYCLLWKTKPAPEAGLGSQNLSLFAGKLKAALLGALWWCLPLFWILVRRSYPTLGWPSPACTFLFCTPPPLVKRVPAPAPELHKSRYCWVSFISTKEKHQVRASNKVVLLTLMCLLLSSLTVKQGCSYFMVWR